MFAYVYNQAKRDYGKTIAHSFICVAIIAIINTGTPFSISSDILMSHYGKVLSCNCMYSCIDTVQSLANNQCPSRRSYNSNYPAS